METPRPIESHTVNKIVAARRGLENEPIIYKDVTEDKIQTTIAAMLQLPEILYVEHIGTIIRKYKP